MHDDLWHSTSSSRSDLPQTINKSYRRVACSLILELLRRCDVNERHNCSTARELRPTYKVALNYQICRPRITNYNTNTSCNVIIVPNSVKSYQALTLFRTTIAKLLTDAHWLQVSSSGSEYHLVSSQRNKVACRSWGVGSKRRLPRAWPYLGPQAYLSLERK